MDEGIEALLGAVVGAIQPESIFRVIADGLEPTPTVNEVAAVLRLLGEPAIGFRPGERPQHVLTRIRELEASVQD
ncbi:hypothetical protein [Nocardia brasiliensis]|uniref:hypothetical protein n=1 Tax=Nocardia brasiliensis TaxID=37326 RepID=UPI0036715A63